MGEAILILFLMFIFVVFPCGILGYLISIKQQRYLIAGWNDEKYKDPEKAAAVIGRSMIWIAFASLIVSLFLMFEFFHDYTVTAFIFFIVFYPVGTLIYVNKKYKIREN